VYIAERVLLARLGRRRVRDREKLARRPDRMAANEASNRVLTVADMVDTSVEKDAGLNQGAKAQQQNVLRIWTWISGVRFGEFLLSQNQRRCSISYTLSFAKLLFYLHT